MRKKIALSLLYFLFVTLTAFAQNFSNGYNFYLPPQDTTGAKFLPRFPARPLTQQDFISIDGAGHFSVRGKPVRFFGANLVAEGAFPPQEKAPFIAGRLRNFGFNLVRFHHLDNPWSQGSLFEQGKDTRHLNPITLDRLDYLIAQLKANGIYLNMNLHVSRTFNTKDGVANADSIWTYGKGVTMFDPQLIALQKEYAAQLLTHVNPYTGLRLVDDPVMAMVEITNENYLYLMWAAGMLKPYSRGGVLIQRHNALLDNLWHQYLAGKYAGTDALKQAWHQDTIDDSDQINNGGFEQSPTAPAWQLELHSPASATITRDVNNAYDGQYAARILVSNTNGTNWHVQWKHINLTLKKDSVYTVSFAARADNNSDISIVVQQNRSPYTVYAGAEIQLTTAWQIFSFSFVAPANSDADTKLAFLLGEAQGRYWLDEVSFGSTMLRGLEPQESLEAGTVRRIEYSECATFTAGRVRDLLAFYLKLQSDYYAEMAGYLKQILGVRVPITSTNLYFSLPDLAVQSQMDYMDNHSYWDHPQFPNEPWSPTNWRINNTAVVQDQSGGTIPYLMAGVRFAGKPYTVSEYNHAFPNRHQSEAVLFLSAYGAFHNVDGLMFFEYNSADDWETDKIDGYFSFHRNTAVMALMPSCAFAYRNQLIASARKILVARYHPDDVLLWPKLDLARQLEGFYPRKLALQHAIVNETFDASTPSDFSSFPPTPENPYVTDTGEITWNSDGMLKVVTPRFVAATGFFEAFPDEPVGAMTLQSGSDFGTLTWLSLSEAPLATAPFSLITLSSQTQNTGMVWDGSNTVHDQWGNAPTTVLPLSLKLRLAVKADVLRLYPLDANGNAIGAYLTFSPVAPNTFEVVLDQKMVPTPWFGVERIGEGTTTVAAQESENFDFALAQNFPNPFNAMTTIRFSMKRAGKARLVLYDMVGREVFAATIQAPAGWNFYHFDGNQLTTGVYLYKLEADGFADIKKMLLLR
jgi:hypothetical protein